MSMRIPVERKILIGFVVVFFIMLIFSGSIYVNMRQIVREGKQLNTNEEVLRLAETVFVSMLDVETAYRGYALTESPMFLEPYHPAKALAAVQAEKLVAITVHDQNMHQKAQKLHSLVKEKLDYGEEIIRQTQTRGSSGATELSRTGRGKRLMDDLRSVVTEIKGNSQQFMDEVNEERIQRADRTVDLFMAVIAGVVIIFVMVYTILKRDLTGRQEAERQLKVNKQMLQSIVDNAPSAIFFKDMEGRYQYVNKTFQAFWRSQGVLGITDETLFSPEIAQQLRKDDLQVLEKKAPVELEEDIPVNGELKNFFTVKFPTYDLYGNIHGVGGIATDITELKRTQQEQLRISDILADLYNHAPCGYHSYDETGLFTSVNQTELSWLGYTYDEVVDRMKIWDISLGKNEENFEAYIVKIKQGNHNVPVEGVLRRKDGSQLAVLINSRALTDQNGKFIGVRSTVVDITERKQLDEQLTILYKDLQQKNIQLQNSNQELEAFSYSVSHDLRSPLRAIHGFASILEEDYRDKLDQEGIRLLHEVMESARLMGHLIDDLLAFSRLGRQEIRESEIDMNELIGKCLIELEKTQQIDTRTIRILPLPEVHGDYALLRQVWINLISNAVKYSRNAEKPQIEIGGSQEADRVVYYIRDNGVGFDMKYVGKLFGVFQRLHSSEEFEGTGVGLAIVKRIISKHGGEVWAEGEVKNGSVFYFSLPVRQNEY